MRNTAFTRTALAAALVAATALLTGCATTTVVGSPSAVAPVSSGQVPVKPVAVSGDTPPDQLLGEAAESTRGAGTARFTVSFDALVAGDGESSPFSTTGHGVIDFDRQVSEGETTIASSDVLGGTTRTIAIDGSLYLQPAGSTRWKKIPLGSAGNAYSQADPAEQLDLLKKAAKGKITEVGDTEVRGTPVRHLTMTLDLSDLLGTSGTTSATTAIPATVDAFVDDQGRLRRVETRIQRALTKVEFYDFGTPVTAQAPDPSLVDVAQR